jgi:hypothetical protein
LIAARCFLAGAGTQNAGLAAGGITSVAASCSEEYNGTSWSAGGVLIVARFAAGGAGIQSAALVAGGYTNVAVSCTEEYLKSSYTIVDCVL